jgi:two-component system, NtrC family, sensor histidine kinase HydH
MQRLDLKLLAPIAVVCLILVGACLFAVLYLNQLHVNVSSVLSENVRSTETAARLETATNKLIELLRSEPPHDEPLRRQQVEQLNQKAEELLQGADGLANLAQERIEVDKAARGWNEYQQRWKTRRDLPATKQVEFDAGLAQILEREVLPPSIALRRFNLDQIGQSDRENQAIVSTIKWSMLLIGVGGTLSGLLLGYEVARRLRHSIYQLSVRIRDAAGRLSREVGSVTLQKEGDLPQMEVEMQHLLEEVSRTVDQLQQREHEVLRAEQLAAVGQLAAGVAHELRNPLTSIKMLVQTGLEGRPPQGLSVEDLSVLESEIRRMEKYIQTFLDFARPPRSERRDCDLLAVVRRAVALVEGRARRQRVEVEQALPAEAVHLNIDPEEIQQVLVNLLLNALDALPRGGRIRVEVAGHASGVEVRVSDNGPGIPAQVRDRLFEPFVTSKENGVGLGLSICKRLVEAHGGAIRGANLPGGGAVVSLTLPVEERAHAVAAGRG